MHDRITLGKIRVLKTTNGIIEQSRRFPRENGRLICWPGECTILDRQPTSTNQRELGRPFKQTT